MAISANERLNVTCEHCGKQFETEVWSLVDAVERPELAQALLDGTLNTAACPHCGASNQSQVAMLYHDSARRRVHFAVPAGVAEYRWREQAQALMYTLAERLPEEARLPYLEDVHIHQEIAGVRRALQRLQRSRSGVQPTFGKPIPLPDSGTPLVINRPVAVSNQVQPSSGLPAAIQQVLAVATLEELHAAVLHYPQLLHADADELLRQMADTAFNDGDREAANALHVARSALADLRAGREVGAAALAAQETEAAAPAEDIPAVVLPDPAYQALLHTASDAVLMDVIRLFPLLLEPLADEDLGQRIEAALDEENERLATLIEDRRDALAALRGMLFTDIALERAVQALLDAPDTDTLETVLNDHPQLLTDGAQQALTTYSSAAQARGDSRAATTAEARRQMLQQVRAGINV